MRQIHYEAYRDLYDIYRTTHSDLDLYGMRPSLLRRYFGTDGLRGLRMIDDAITRSQAELGLLDRLRPDAKFFLLLNVHQMIYLPLQYADGEDKLTINMEEGIRADVRTIMETAVEGPNKEEISGHMIIEALSRAWGTLRTTKLNVWG